MENIPDKLEEINWLRLDDHRSPKKKQWFTVIESNGIELLQKCTKLEDVEHVLHEKLNKLSYRYTKDQLLKLRMHPLSTKTPTLCDNLKFLCSKNTTKSKEKDDFDPKKAPLKKHGVTRPFDQVNEKLDSKKNEKLTVTFRTDKIDERKVTDPASRLRKEQDICLSPQRKSFNTGCYVPNAKNETIVISNSTTNKQNPESNVNQSRENREVKENRNAREVPRRIGSGRIITSDPQFVIRGYPENRQIPKEKPTVVYKCTFQGKSNDKEKEGFWDRPKNNNYYDKRRYQYSDNHYDGEDTKDRIWDQQRNNNFFERRRHYNSEYHREDDEEKEPEWMKDGPGSKNDMIELKGFDENVEKFFRGGRYNNKSSSRFFHKNEGIRSPHSTAEKLMVNGKDQPKRNSESDNSSVTSDSTLTTAQEHVVETKTDEKPKNVDATNAEKNISDQNIVKQPEIHSIEINLDDIFKEPLPDISANSDVNESMGSKFTRWFKRDDVGAVANSAAEPNSRPASGFGGSFNPPVNSTPNMKSMVTMTPSNTLPGESKSGPASNLLDLLRGSQENAGAAPKQDVRSLVTGKLHNLEEIEAKLRGTDANKQASLNAVDKKKKEEETEAFKKLLSQAVKPNDSLKKLAENNANDGVFGSQKTKTENLQNLRAKSDLSSLLCNGDTHSSFPPNMLPPQVSRMSPMTVGKQFQLQQNKQQQELLSKMLISSTGNYTIPPPTGVRPMNSPITSGPFSQISPEIQSRINDCPMTREMMQRPETMNILRALRNGDFTIHQLIEQYKKTTPSNQKFRESVICVLKIIQNSSYPNSTPFMGSSVGVAFNVPPPSHLSQPPFSENIIQQMMMNSQYRSGIPNIVYQRDFSAQNQNMYQSNINKKHPSEQQQNVNQSCSKMNSPPITINAASASNVIGNAGMSGSSGISTPRENKNVTNLSLKSSPASQSHSFTPLSVLRKLSAEKENLDGTFSKDSKESKTGDMLAAYSQSNTVNLQNTIVSSGYASPISSTLAWNSAKSMAGEKTALIPYSSNTISQSGNVTNLCVNTSVIDHFSNFGTCIPPPAISGQYFVGNVIRPSISSQVPIFGGPPPSILSRLPVSSNVKVLAKGTQNQKLPSNPSQLHQLQMRSISAQIAQGHDTYNVSHMNRLLSDGSTSSSNCGNQNMSVRNPFVNGLSSSGDEQLNRLFSVSNVNSSFPLSAANASMSVQNIMSLEEIERIQQSVRN